MNNAIHLRQGAVGARTLDELIGLCKGIIADGVVCQSEAVFILNWLEANKHIAHEFPANVLYPRLVEMLADNKLDVAESKELLDMLMKMTGERGFGGAVPMPCTIAFNDPLPIFAFDDTEFCLTGEFAYGRRKDVESRISTLGGKLLKSVVKRGCILVVGCMGSGAWLHSTHGTKMLDAVSFREQGHPVIIVPEEHWHKMAEKAESADNTVLEQIKMRIL